MNKENNCQCVVCNVEAALLDSFSTQTTRDHFKALARNYPVFSHFQSPLDAVAKLHEQGESVNHDAGNQTINDTHWPAYRKENSTLVDLRILDPNDRSPKPLLIFQPEALRKTGIPEPIIEAAARSNPPGLVLFEDVPQLKGCDDQPTSLESTR